MTLLIILAVFVVGASLAYWAGRRSAKRADREVSAWTSARSLHYTARDDSLGTLRWGPPFGVGYRYRAQNVITGELDGREVLCFNFSYAVKRGTKADAHHFANIVAVRGPEAIGDLDVASRSAGRPAVRGLPDSGQELESDRFNTTFRIGGDERFASAVLHPRMMHWLLDTTSPGFRIHGPWFALVRQGSLNLGTLDADLAHLLGVIDRIPDYLWRSA